MYLISDIKQKFINESADTLIDSLDNYSEYINENLDFEYYTELVAYNLIGYYQCEKFLTSEGRYSAFSIVSDYVNDYKDLFGESPKDINSEFIYQFYLDSFMTDLVRSLDDKLNYHPLCLFDENGLKQSKVIGLIEEWRANEIEELNKLNNFIY